MIVSSSPEQPPPGAGTVQSGAEAHRAALRDDWQRITKSVHHQPLPGRKGKGKGKKAQTRQVQAWALRRTKPSPEEFENTSTFLKQLIRLVTAANRNCRGYLVWMSWSGTDTKNKNPMPQHVSALLAFSFRGTLYQKEEFCQHIARSHFDISLKWMCENHAQEVQDSFVMSTIGHYSSHDSHKPCLSHNVGMGPVVCRRRARDGPAHDVG